MGILHENRRRSMWRGMTFVELLVAIFILVAGMEGFTILFIQSWKTNGFVLELGVDSAAASRATDTIVKDLRKVRQADNGDYPVKSGDGFNLTVYIDIDNDGVTERVHYFLENRQMKRGVTKPTAPPNPTYQLDDQTFTVLADNIDNTVSEPVFSYYNADYPGDTVHNPLALPVDASDIRLVKIRILVNFYPNRAPEDVSIESFVELRNLNSYVQ